jgi:hypothetical protein
MGVPTSEVGYTSATTGRGNHEVHKGHVVALEKKKTDMPVYSIPRRIKKLFFSPERPDQVWDPSSLQSIQYRRQFAVLSSRYTTSINNQWSYTPIPTHAFMAYVKKTLPPTLLTLYYKMCPSCNIQFLETSAVGRESIPVTISNNALVGLASKYYVIKVEKQTVQQGFSMPLSTRGHLYVVRDTCQH